MAHNAYAYLASFEILCSDFHRLAEYVEPTDANLKTFSHRLYELLLRACTDFESVCKEELVATGYARAQADMNINDYKTLEGKLQLEQLHVGVLIWRPAPAYLRPFAGWSTASPPLAVDRLIGLARVPNSLVYRIEDEKKLPSRLKGAALDVELRKMGNIIERMADPDIFVWLKRPSPPTEEEIHRAATIVADRLCGSVANPIIRNAQEKRQLAAIKAWLEARRYKQISPEDGIKFQDMPPRTFSFRMNVPVTLEGGKQVNIPVDTVIMPKKAKQGDLPVIFEAKSAGDFTNVNKRRKEEAVKMSQLRDTYGKAVRFNLFLCGYFDSGYLGYEAAEGIDWVWEHRIDDLAKFGL